MCPSNATTPGDKRRSGNPATQAGIDASITQQREQKRREKLAEHERRLSRRRRSRVVWWTVGSAAAILVVAAVVASVALAPKAPYEAGGTGAVIEGVQTYDNTTEHTEDPVDYPQTPPAGGPHNPVWLNCGVYSEPVPNENAVHSLEHGAIWVTYDASALSADDLAALEAKLPSTYVVLSPYEGLPSALVLTGWNHQLALDFVDDPRIPEFIEEYWRNQNVPEPSAACTGGYDAPGRQS